MKQAAVILILASLLCACATRPRQGHPDALDYTPVRFRAEIGGWSGPSYSIEMLTSTKVRYTWKEGGQIVEETVLQPPADYWETVYDGLESANVFKWRERYVKKGVSDGTQWAIEIEVGKRKKKIWGDNAYPEYGEFRDFLRVMSDLAGGRKFE